MGKINIGFSLNELSIMSYSSNCMLSETKRLLKLFDIRPKKLLSQSFIVSIDLIRDIIDSSLLSSSDIVLEIGAGLGTLTRFLADRAGEVVAIEVDPRLFRVLKWVLRGYDNVKLICGDALKIDFPPVDKVISNLPFKISSPITFKLIEGPKFNFAVLTYQREFADRLVAEPGAAQYGRLTVAASLFARVELVRYASRFCFYPPPSVDVAVVKVHPKMKSLDDDERFLLELLRYFFSQRNRKLRSPLLRYLVKVKNLSKSRSMGILGSVPYSEYRVRDLSPKQFLEVARIIRRELMGVEGSNF